VQQEWLLILPAVAGIAMGLLYAVSGFRDAGKGADIKTSPRVTNLRWIATVGAASLIGDWRQLNDGVQISKVSMTGAYLVAVIITAILAIFVIARSLYKNRKQEISQSGTAGNISARDAAWLYVHSGFAAYREEMQREREREEAKAVVAQADIRGHQLQSCASLAYAICAQLSACSAVRHDAPAEFRDAVIDTLLDNILSAVVQQTGLPKGTFDINFMVALSFADTIEKYSKITRFIFDGHDKYSHLLILKRYHGRAGGDDFGLPVHAPDSTARVLPGAPAAFATGMPKYIQSDDFGAELRAFKAAERNAISGYLEDQPFLCFLSLPITWGGKRIGIVNVESKAANFGIESDPAENFAKALLPFCMLLGNVVSSAISK
jgi:hypothetical protein